MNVGIAWRRNVARGLSWMLGEIFFKLLGSVRKSKLFQ